ncbi:MAG: anthranilate synthase component I family protein [Propionibacteriaceae bacterium]|jgi:anthranilate synthase component 1|nr:anthranilate synthase component I family protein [Propionibacteriaceae bacterium]
MKHKLLSVELPLYQRYARDYRVAPVVMRMTGLTRSPIEVFRALKHVSKQCFILESLEDNEKDGRYTFLGYDPATEVTCKDGRLTIRGPDGTYERQDVHPGTYIARVIAENRSPRIPGLPPFTGGLVGYFSFDYLKYAEPSLKFKGVDEEGFRDVDLMLFDKVIAFDHLEQAVYLIYNMALTDVQNGLRQAIHELDDMRVLVYSGERAEIAPLQLTGDFEALFDKAGFVEIVDKAKHHIREGDIFQVVLSNRLKAPAAGSLFETYRRLRELNPSPYMFYFSSDDLEIAGASPETLVKLSGDRLTTFPLAGTRPRGQTPEEDAALEAGLLADDKELSEHNMLVDLGRNDLGKISEFGSVRVLDYLSVLRFSHVMHIGSTVEGQIRKSYSAIDAVDAVLPAGTLSGAPKIRACEIIDELEDNRRGVYGGAIGYISNTGDLDTCIAIRIAYKKNGQVYVRAGAGIVADSVPENEYQECENKMAAVRQALLDVSGHPGRGEFPAPRADATTAARLPQSLQERQ